MPWLCKLWLMRFVDFCHTSQCAYFVMMMIVATSSHVCLASIYFCNSMGNSLCRILNHQNPCNSHVLQQLLSLMMQTVCPSPKDVYKCLQAMLVLILSFMCGLC